MILQVYVIMEPGADRPYFSHTPPTEYQRKDGAKIYLFEGNIPEWFIVDGRITAVGKLLEEPKEPKT
jgi:hypothetical protein